MELKRPLRREPSKASPLLLKLQTEAAQSSIPEIRAWAQETMKENKPQNQMAEALHKEIQDRLKENPEDEDIPKLIKLLRSYRNAP